MPDASDETPRADLSRHVKECKTVLEEKSYRLLRFEGKPGVGTVLKCPIDEDSVLAIPENPAG